ncbi:MAG TPA: hypothetical protein PL029_04875, partial [Bacteroidia bacterium]|nr:hypothetical protein [Bacteroidia bacterium]
VDLSIVDGIVRTAKAYNISDILITYKPHQTTSNIMFGNIAGNLLSKSKQGIIISKILQPLNTFERLIVVLTPNAELENGFTRAVTKINCLLKQLGSNSVLYGLQSTLDSFANISGDKKKTFYKYIPVSTFENFDQAIPPKTDDLFILLSARKQTLSYNFHVEDLPRKLNRNNEFTSFVMFYPDISKALQDGGHTDLASVSAEERYQKVKQFTGKITGIFKKDGDEENAG